MLHQTKSGRHIVVTRVVVHTYYYYSNRLCAIVVVDQTGFHEMDWSTKLGLTKNDKKWAKKVEEMGINKRWIEEISRSNVLYSTIHVVFYIKHEKQTVKVEWETYSLYAIIILCETVYIVR